MPQNWWMGFVDEPEDLPTSEVREFCRLLARILRRRNGEQTIACPIPNNRYLMKVSDNLGGQSNDAADK